MASHMVCEPHLGPRPFRRSQSVFNIEDSIHPRRLPAYLQAHNTLISRYVGNQPRYNKCPRVGDL